MGQVLLMLRPPTDGADHRTPLVTFLTMQGAHVKPLLLIAIWPFTVTHLL
jgi:hypothetical protein